MSTLNFLPKMQESECNCGKNLNHKEIAFGLQKDLYESKRREKELENKISELENSLTSEF